MANGASQMAEAPVNGRLEEMKQLALRRIEEGAPLQALNDLVHDLVSAGGDLPLRGMQLARQTLNGELEDRAALIKAVQALV